MNEKTMNQKGGDFEHNPIPLCTDVPDGEILEKKKKKKRKNKNKGKTDTVEVEDLNGSDEVISNSFLEELDDSNGSVCEDTKPASGGFCCHSGKENQYFGWQWQKRQHNAADGQRHWVRGPRHRYGGKHVQPLENSVWVEHNYFSGIANELVFSGHGSVAYGVKKIGHKEPFMYGRTPQRVLHESSQWAASQQRWNGNLHGYAWVPSRFGGFKKGHAHDKLVGTSTDSCRPESYNEKKGLGKNVFGLHGKSVSYQKEFPYVPFGMQQYKNRDSSRRNFYNGQHVAGHGYISGQGGINGNRPRKIMKIPVMEHNFGRFYTSLDCTSIAEFRYHSDHKFRKDVTSGASTMKWRPTGTKESRPVEETFSAGTCNGLNLNLPVLSKGWSESHQEGSSITFSSSATSSDTKCTNSISGHQLPPACNDHPKVHKSATEIEGQKSDNQDCETNGRRTKESVQFVIGSQLAVRALNAAYKMQLASETFQLAMEGPVAEFERLIHCAAPVIASSYIHKQCSVCLDTQQTHGFLCEHQIPNLSLRTVWNWYEKPGNYGLDVKADDSKNLNGSMSFHAHFVPSLSAVQLFRPHNPGSKALVSTHSPEAAELNHIQAGIHNFDLVKESVGSARDGRDPLSLDYAPNSELIFEFFESAQPQQRKPLYNKILELICVEPSNHLIFGNPSKLDCLNLHELHPASWFSVAWYPIYRIPEGNLRASFLTYHSLGHFVQRPVSTDASNKCISRIFSPVLGLQSYNAQGECWFDPKVAVGYSSKEPTSFNSAEILKERLRTLEENALCFARGCVCKDKVMVSNRHPDYEFFISRKTHYR